MVIILANDAGIAESWAAAHQLAADEWVYPTSGYTLRSAAGEGRGALVVDLGGGNASMRTLVEWWVALGRARPWDG